MIIELNKSGRFLACVKRGDGRRGTFSFPLPLPRLLLQRGPVVTFKKKT